MSKELLEKIVAWLQDEVNNTDMTEGIAEDCDDFLMAGRRECAEGLLAYIASQTQEKSKEKQNGV